MNRLSLFIILFFGISSFGQQLEFGPALGYTFNNIADGNSDESRVVIGDALWNFNYGFKAIYYFKDPAEQPTLRIGLLYRNQKRGSRSEMYDDNKYEFNANTFGATVGIGGAIGKGYIFYLDVGLGYSRVDNTDIYKGRNEELVAFPKLENPLIVKSDDVNFLFALGLEKNITRYLKAFLELNGDTGITKINFSNGKFTTRSLGFGAGFRYIINFKSKVSANKRYF